MKAINKVIYKIKIINQIISISPIRLWIRLIKIIEALLTVKTILTNVWKCQASQKICKILKKVMKKKLA